MPQDTAGSKATTRHEHLGVSAGTVRVHGWIFRSVCRHHHLFLLFFFVSSSTSSRDLMSVAMPKLSMPTRTDVHCCTCTQHVLLPIVLGSVGSVKNMSGARLLCWCFLSSSVQQRRRVFVFCFHWVPPLSVRLLPRCAIILFRRCCRASVRMWFFRCRLEVLWCRLNLQVQYLSRRNADWCRFVRILLSFRTSSGTLSFSV